MDYIAIKNALTQIDRNPTPTPQEIQTKKVTITVNFKKENSMAILLSNQLPGSSNKFKTTLAPPITVKKPKEKIFKQQ